MADLATLQSHRTALETARASGELSITYQGKRVEYRSIEEIERALAAIDREIAALGSASVPAVTVAAFRRQRT